VAGYLDAPAADVRARWPSDAVEVTVEGERRWLLEDAASRAALEAPAPDGVRLLGAFDLFLQARDRNLLVADKARTKALWPVLGRPGAVLAGTEVAGMWRARKAGKRLHLTVTRWSGLPRDALTEQAERLAAFRGLALTSVVVED
jgi:hypothetical protein